MADEISFDEIAAQYLARCGLPRTETLLRPLVSLLHETRSIALTDALHTTRLAIEES